MKSCPVCQTDNTDDAVHCEKCGVDLTELLAHPNELDILLQIRDLMKQELKHSQEIQGDYRKYRNEEREYLERAEKHAQRNARINTVAIGIFILAVVIIIALT